MNLSLCHLHSPCCSGHKTEIVQNCRNLPSWGFYYMDLYSTTSYNHWIFDDWRIHERFIVGLTRSQGLYSQHGHIRLPPVWAWGHIAAWKRKNNLNKNLTSLKSDPEHTEQFLFTIRLTKHSKMKRPILPEVRSFEKEKNRCSLRFNVLQTAMSDEARIGPFLISNARDVKDDPYPKLIPRKKILKILATGQRNQLPRCT